MAKKDVFDDEDYGSYGWFIRNFTNPSGNELQDWNDETAAQFGELTDKQKKALEELTKLQDEKHKGDITDKFQDLLGKFLGK